MYYTEQQLIDNLLKIPNTKSKTIGNILKSGYSRTRFLSPGVRSMNKKISVDKYLNKHFYNEYLKTANFKRKTEIHGDGIDLVLDKEISRHLVHMLMNKPDIYVVGCGGAIFKRLDPEKDNEIKFKYVDNLFKDNISEKIEKNSEGATVAFNVKRKGKDVIFTISSGYENQLKKIKIFGKFPTLTDYYKLLKEASCLKTTDQSPENILNILENNKKREENIRKRKEQEKINKDAVEQALKQNITYFKDLSIPQLFRIFRRIYGYKYKKSTVNSGVDEYYVIKDEKNNEYSLSSLKDSPETYSLDHLNNFETKIRIAGKNNNIEITSRGFNKQKFSDDDAKALFRELKITRGSRRKDKRRQEAREFEAREEGERSWYNKDY